MCTLNLIDLTIINFKNSKRTYIYVELILFKNIAHIFTLVITGYTGLQQPNNYFVIH